MRTRLAGPFVIVLALLPALACGGKKAPPPAPPPAAPPAEAHPGIDPEVLKAYEEAPVPPPVPFAASPLRDEAMKGGAFDGLPSADPEALPALLAAFAAAKEAAAAHPGTTTGGAAGPSLVPSREQMRFAELTDRITTALAGAPAGEAKAAWQAAGLGAEAIEGFTLEVVTAKVFGTGYMTTIEQRPVAIAVPK
jgi:hypothetical protein